MIQKSGAHQYGGGWAMRATKKRRVWEPNLHSVKVTYGGRRQTMRLCTKCLRRVKRAMVVKKMEGKSLPNKFPSQTPITPQVLN